MSTVRRFRVKQRLFRRPLVVLQVGTKIEFDDGPRPGSFTRWRDAGIEDLTEHTTGEQHDNSNNT